MLSGQFIAFQLNNEEFSIPILQVQEIIKPVPTTKIPESPDYINGIINLRGKVIPVIELKKRMGINDNGADTRDKRIIVVNAGRLTIGGIVDNITGVIDITEDIVETNIELVSSAKDDYIKGVATLSSDRIVQILDFTKLLSGIDLYLLQENIINEELSEDGSVIVTKKVSGMGGEYIIKEVKERLIEQAESKGVEKETIEQIMVKIQLFLDALSEGALEEAERILLELSTVGEKELFTEVGKITRNLHNALTEFKTLIDPRLKNMALEEMPEAADKLQWVITKTEEAAEKTIGLMEKNLSLQSDIVKRLDILDDFLKQKEMEDGEEKEAIRFLRRSLEEMNTDFMEVLLAQEYQDLTGQIIKRVITLVTELEGQLVRLIKVFGVKIEPEKKDEYLKGPTTEEAEDSLTSQEDVDALLKEFGF